VHLQEVDQISIAGHSNTVTWRTAGSGSRPKVSILNGFDNQVQQLR
jgi:hypothetical protein